MIRKRKQGPVVFPSRSFVDYFDQLLGAARIQKLVETYKLAKIDRNQSKTDKKRYKK